MLGIFTKSHVSLTNKGVQTISSSSNSDNKYNSFCRDALTRTVRVFVHVAGRVTQFAVLVILHISTEMGKF